MKSASLKTERQRLAVFFLTWVTLTLSGTGNLLLAQQNMNQSSGLYPGFGIGIGVFYPGDVNEYIEAHLPGNIISSYGNTDLYMYEELHAFLTYKIKWIDITGLLEYAIGPKWIIISGSTNQFYNFNRVSPGLLVNFYFPAGSGRHAFYLGGGSQYHFMKFEEYSGSKIGFRVNAGYSIQFKKLNLQPNFAFNFANARESDPHESHVADYQIFDLNYTGGQIGINLSFHQPVAHR